MNFRKLCPICLSKVNKITCKRCGHDFVNQNISKNYYLNKENRNPILKNNYSKNLERLNDLRNLIKESKTILDIGCAEGLFLEIIKNKFNKLKCYGIEPSKDKHQSKTNKVKIFKSFKELKEIRIKFDMITCFHVLEHVQDINKFIKNSIFFLKDNGHFVIEVPNKNGNLLKFDDNNLEHFHKFSVTSLCMLLEKNKLDIIKIETRKIESPIYNNCMRIVFKRDCSHILKKKFKQKINLMIKKDFIFYGIGFDYEKIIHPFINNYSKLTLLDSYRNEYYDLKKIIRYNDSFKNRKILITSYSNEEIIYKQLIKMKHPKKNIVLFSKFLNNLN